MELNSHLLNEITEIFNSVQYGRITFFVSPEKKTLDYSVETTGKLNKEPEKVNGRRPLLVKKST